MNNKIGLFDSGIGGLSVLRELIQLLPHENYLFYEDSIHVPYGEKSDEELFDITSHIVDYLLGQNCKIIVIACNTATTSCMSRLREKYPDTIFVGTVPAIKVAYDAHSSKTLILSTPYTMKSSRVRELVTEYQRDDQEIINISGENLATLIDFNEKDEIQNLLNRILSPYQDSVDSVILGCTHYSLIKQEIQSVLPNAKLLDGAYGVAKEVRHQLEEHNLLNPSSIQGNIEIVNSKDNSYVKRSFELLDL